LELECARLGSFAALGKIKKWSESGQKVVFRKWSKKKVVLESGSNCCVFANQFFYRILMLETSDVGDVFFRITIGAAMVFVKRTNIIARPIREVDASLEDRSNLHVWDTGKPMFRVPLWILLFRRV
jgi:hypothetical protein